MDSDVCSAHRINMDPTPLPLHRLTHLQHMYICIVDTQLGQCTASSERIRYTIYNCYEPMLTALLVLGSEMQAVANQLLMVLTTEASAHGTSIMHIQLGCELGVSIPCLFRHSNEVNEGVSRVQDVTQ